MAYNAGVAILIAFIAGFATVIGGLLSLLLTKHMRPLTFAAALAFAAGCTLTVAFADVLPEGQEAWHKALSGSDDDHADDGDDDGEELHACIGLLVMLVGWVLASLFDTVLHLSLDAYDHYSNSGGEHFHVGVCAHDHGHDHTHHSRSFHAQPDHATPMMTNPIDHDLEAAHHTHGEQRGPLASVPPQGAYQDLVSAPLTTVSQQIYYNNDTAMSGDGIRADDLAATDASTVQGRGFWRSIGHFLKRCIISKSTLTPSEQKAIDYQFRADAKRISRLGYFTACVLALHNIPEGIALYGTLMVDGKSGIGLAIAISLHNLPQGMAVAVPIYIGHDSKFQAILFSAAAALAQPLGALIGYGIVGTDPSPLVMSIMLLLTSGVLFNASLKELYGSAVRYDRGNQLCGSFVFIGMLVLSCTLICLACV